MRPGYGAGHAGNSKDACSGAGLSRPRRVGGVLPALLGGDITYADDDWVNLRDGGNVLLSFQRAPGYQAPDWPARSTASSFTST